MRTYHLIRSGITPDHLVGLGSNQQKGASFGCWEKKRVIQLPKGVGSRELLKADTRNVMRE